MIGDPLSKVLADSAPQSFLRQSGGCSPTAQATPARKPETLRRRSLSPRRFLPPSMELLMRAAPLSCSAKETEHLPPVSVPFWRFFLFSPCRAPARLLRKKQKSLKKSLLTGASQFPWSKFQPRQGKSRREYFRIVKAFNAVWAEICPRKPAGVQFPSPLFNYVCEYSLAAALCQANWRILALFRAGIVAFFCRDRYNKDKDETSRSFRASAHTGVGIRFPCVESTDCHTSDIGHWFAMTGLG